ncbi:probable tRNA N6-adenosine threonylcarbamoyltransferase, mitochondrial isoform X3 [Arachis hypogaea]|nr:probable tRNA N6-adenosine threonylcarbamoyltransferase, mitochondrial isoform X3 [Arachis hypogaea]
MPRSLFLLQVRKIDWPGLILLLLFSELQCYILRKGLNVQSRWALKMEPSIRHLVISGGVTSNQYVRSRLDIVVKKNGLQLVCPPPWPCTDNGVMVAWTGIEHFRMGRYHPSLPAEEPEDFVVCFLISTICFLIDHQYIYI